MSWNWVAVLGIVVLAWTVFRVTQMWQQVTVYKHAPDYVKRSVAKQSGLIDDE